MFKKRMNKKGQELWQLLVLLLGIAVVAIVIIGAIFGFDKIFGLFRPVGGELELVAQQCKLAAENNLVTSYCIEFKEVKIAGETQYVNCQDSRIVLEDAGLKSQMDSKCSNGEQSAKSYCEQLKASLGGKYDEEVLVNNRPCGKGANNLGVPKEAQPSGGSGQATQQ
jgi:hypothetical protein